MWGVVVAACIITIQKVAPFPQSKWEWWTLPIVISFLIPKVAPFHQSMQGVVVAACTAFLSTLPHLHQAKLSSKGVILIDDIIKICAESTLAACTGCAGTPVCFGFLPAGERAQVCA
jgi:hypothetical protein